MRIVFFGNRCPFSVPPLSALIESGYPPVAIILPGPPAARAIVQRQSASSHSSKRVLPMSGLPAIDRIAVTANATLLTIGELNSEPVIDAIKELQPDLFIAACFPRRLPAALLALPCLGAFNIHPSRLPRWRGPEPLFWTFQAGDNATGVSIHQMTETFDAGPLIAQHSMAMPTATTRSQLELLLASMGGAMLANLMPAIARGNMRSWPQPLTGVTYAPLPQIADWIAPPDWSTARALQFIQGVASETTPVSVTSPQGQLIKVSSATYTAPPGGQPAPDGHCFARFSDGCLLARAVESG